MKFLRIVNNNVYVLHEVDNPGFDIKNPMYIPDEYLENQQFVIMRCAFGIGDWGIITSFPKKLKSKYPNCTVHLPSVYFLEKLFGKRYMFDNSYKNVLSLFDNNPYVDGFIDNTNDEIFHCHYRIYDTENPDVPLLKQILKFWQFDDFTDIQPSIYFTEDEIKLGDEIISMHTSDSKFGCLLLSDRFGTQNGIYDEKTYNNDVKKINSLLHEHDYQYFYWSYKPLSDTPFKHIKKILDLRHIPLRIQLYIKSKATVNIGNQCGTSESIARYSKTYEVQRQFPLNGNFVEGIQYV